MERLVVACVQQRMRVFATVEDYRLELQRFLRIAQHKRAALVVFPELGGTMLAPPLLRTSRIALLKYAEQGRRRKASVWQRQAGRVARWAAKQYPIDFSTTMAVALDAVGQELWATYCTLFSELAEQYKVTIVAPSGYFPDPEDGVVRNITGVFGPDGVLLGRQAKVMVHGDDKVLGEAGRDWNVIHTEAGIIGILLGSDVLYPEIGRLLAYKGAELLIGQGACPTTVHYQKLRAGILARMQDNQLFAAASYLVGQNDLNGRTPLLYTGRSAILAPQELTPRFNGVLVEMGSPSSEGVLSADWNYLALRKLWDLSETPIRRDMPFKQIGRVVAGLYARLQQAPNLLDEGDDDWLVTQPGVRMLPIGQPVLRLDELPIMSTITRRWPPAKVDYTAVDTPVDLTTAVMPELSRPSSYSESIAQPKPDRLASPSSISSASEDETEEMDALAEPHSDERTD